MSLTKKAMFRDQIYVQEHYVCHHVQL